MKIPETPSNIGAYYGNEENGQWQANGVMIDSGVGGGIVGSGDAGYVHHGPPLYPIRPHMPTPGYVMAGAFYAGGAAYAHAPPTPDDFADYMWMENEEEFDKQVMQQLEEEALMEQCIEAMLEDERERERNRPVNGHAQLPTTSNGVSSLSLEEQVSKSTLNPLAAEFVPATAPAPASDHADAQEDKEQLPAAEPQALARDPRPERSPEAEPRPEAEPAPAPPEPAKSETTTPAEEPVTQAPTIPAVKPINYAAAAKANKPKKSTTPPATEKIVKPSTTVARTEKVKEKPAQRKAVAK